jgi:hypothetical protein
MASLVITPASWAHSPGGVRLTPVDRRARPGSAYGYAVSVRAGGISLVGLILASVASGCGSDCKIGCQGPQSATLDLSCAPAAVTRAELTGPCAPPPDASLVIGGLGFSCPLAAQPPFVDCDQVSFSSNEPGDCHVSLTFASGFTYSGDVHFATTPRTCGCDLPQGPFPTPAVLTVNNRDATCGSARADF